jgi:hypothetical protein
VIALGHVGGVPIEEMLPAFAGMGGGLVGVRVWLALGVRARKDGKR